MMTHFLRFYARWKLFGFKNFDIGDLFAGLAMVSGMNSVPVRTLSDVEADFLQSRDRWHISTEYV